VQRRYNAPAPGAVVEPPALQWHPVRMNPALLLAAALAASSPSPPPSPPREAARRGFDLSQARFRTGQSSVEEVCLWSRRVRDAAPRSEAEDRAHLERLRSLGALVQDRFKAGVSTQLDVVAVEFHLADAEAERAGK
jgi:hypothetical protein